MNAHSKNCVVNWQPRQGFTLVEVVLMILLVGILAAMAISVVGESDDAQRFEDTRRKMEEIREAILGTATTGGDGHKSSFGYHGDLGGLPAQLNSLTNSHTPVYVYNRTFGFGAGWKGPYFHNRFNNVYPISTDAWGNAFVYSTSGSPPEPHQSGGRTGQRGAPFTTKI